MKKAISIGLVLVLYLATVNLAAADTWTRKTDMPTARRNCAASEVNGKIYVIGGWDSWMDPTPLATVEVYDPVMDTWKRKADMPTARGTLATAVLDGKIYAIGGAYGQSPTINLSTVEVYDPVTDTWEEGVSMSTGTCFHSAVVLEGRIYTIGGFSNTMTGGSYIMEEFDANIKTWSRKASMPTARWVFGAGVVNGRIYVIGGDTSGGVTSSVLEYDVIADSWIRKANMPTARAGLCAAVVRDKIYCMGGNLSPSSSGFQTLEIYNPVTDTWKAKADMLTPRADSAIATANGKIYVFGGFSDRICSTVEEYTPPIIVDFNSDGIVDCADMCMMIDYWGTDEPLYDIAPPPSGDGVVGFRDLAVLTEHWLEDHRLIAHWKLDETEGTIAYDSIGSNDGILIGDPNWQPTDGKVDGALEFNGTDNYISTDFVLNPVSGFSAFAWVKGGEPGQVVISQADRRSGRNIIPGSIWLGTDPSDGKLITSLMDIYFPPLESESVITNDQWHHIGLVYDLEQLHRCLYVDGVEVAKDTEIVGGVSSDGGLYIGAGKDLDAASLFSGLIDDICIYNVALSAKEIEELAH